MSPMLTQVRRLVTIASVALLLAACSSSGDTEPAPDGQLKGDSSVTGEVTYRAKIAMPPKARVEITLQNISTQDTDSIVVGRQQITDVKEVPIPFDVVYDSGAILDSDTYALQAVIFRDDKIWMSNRETYAVITQGNQTSNIRLIVELAL